MRKIDLPPQVEESKFVCFTLLSLSVVKIIVVNLIGATLS
jgi:hypothetical protein